MIKKILLALSALLGLVFSLGSEGAFKSSLFDGDLFSDKEELEIVYVQWDTEIASTHVIASVLEEAGYQVKMTSADVPVMWASLASGDVDGMVAAWLPQTHGSYYDEFGDQMEDLGPNLRGAKIGLVVPSYMPVSSIADLTTEANATITAIEPGTGVVMATERALESYPNLGQWQIETASTGAMTTALGQAIDRNEEIVVTGWSPHWKFQTYDLKYLDDPEGDFGGEETINTMVRHGLKEDHPRAYQILDRFEWEMEDMESVMLDIADGTDPQQAADKWIEANRDKVDSWLAE
ncbi:MULTISPECIES: glycine betaine ABC transporter substrate-binding protein [Aerococcus]|uniref:Glycine betaine ABC transporter substrate-binding protein n=1 Tax=Aerococcus sanguinicola TaxID=119206 RepID=A0A5N1GNK5_9LACT|nr:MULTISPECIES: glycine betaine ABC transporter substrate-binding protein [Aerococcus]KAA9300310.1 glycine betaine ABC transporter substrate-binding protein [Aerococcus sanguinicola]MDK6369887.1 glycine betaine ABC transporter substrate-binding protein [Aerococcus sp. UMB9870]MDK6686845.1 glycine betaine ABC transporter substrate-binding protein [Aerococcus sp. UMB8623]OFK18231.1 glycine/betaine ABC transporter substrate-binding protein [Aerococcus sp. HMSC072A12]OFR35115.1 glycine/betaine AB